MNDVTTVGSGNSIIDGSINFTHTDVIYSTFSDPSFVINNDGGEGLIDLCNNIFTNSMIEIYLNMDVSGTSGGVGIALFKLTGLSNTISIETKEINFKDITLQSSIVFGPINIITSSNSYQDRYNLKYSYRSEFYSTDFILKRITIKHKRIGN